MNDNEALYTAIAALFPAYGVLYWKAAVHRISDDTPFMGVVPRKDGRVRSSLLCTFGRGLWTEADVKALAKLI